MSFIMDLFNQLFGTTIKTTISAGQSQLRTNTIGKVEGKILSKQSELQQKVLHAQRSAIDKVTFNNRKGAINANNQGPQTKMPQGNMPQGNMPQGGMPQGGMPQGGMPQGGMRPPGSMMQPGYGPPGAMQPGYGHPGGMMAPGAPNYGGAQGGVEKTAAIDISQFQEKERQVVGRLVAQNGPHKGQDFRLYSGKNVLGTAADCDLVITDPYLSAKHCTVRYENGNFVLIDLDSRNGTVVNQKRISKEDLIDNDTVRLGKTEFKFKSLF